MLRCIVLVLLPRNVALLLQTQLVLLIGVICFNLNSEGTLLVSTAVLLQAVNMTSPKITAYHTYLCLFTVEALPFETSSCFPAFPQAVRTA